MAIKTLILLRHAHRDKIPSVADNGLSEKGWHQAADVANALAKKFGKDLATSPMAVESSPLMRCLETADAVAKKVGLEPKINELLKEYSKGESVSDFVMRIKAYLTHWKQHKATTLVACSHGDWIPEALRLWCDKEITLRKGAFVELTLDTDSGEITLGRVRDPEAV
jgi:broad specificity phosphatase PhoE